MMKNRSFFLALALCLAAGAAYPCHAAPKTADTGEDTKEPSLVYTLKVGDKSLTVTEGNMVRLDGIFSNPEITLTANPYRVFPYGGIEFQYPRDFSFEADHKGSEYKNWTLTGNGLTLLYFIFEAPVKTEDFVSSMVEQFGKGNSKVTNSNAKLLLGNGTLGGVSLQVTLAKVKLATEIYRIPSSGTASKFLVLQDTLTDSGGHTAAYTKTVKGITASFTMTR